LVVTTYDTNHLSITPSFSLPNLFPHDVTYGTSDPVMADSASENTSPKPDPAPEESREDAETRATRRELKQSSISDPAPADDSTTAAADDDGTPNPATPPADVSEPKDDQILSPKKKRAHDQVEENGEPEGEDAKSTASTDSARDRAARLEPEKKRHRDGDTAESSTVGSIFG
jgi:DEAD/DEAH box helicase domain-containing protein